MPRTSAIVWRGLAASAGVASGRAHPVSSERDLFGVEDGAVLVIHHPTPSILPALAQARAAVCETGGVLNHLAVLARELGKPCVTGVPGLVEAIEPGSWLQVDGSRGSVTLLAGGPRQPPPAAPAGGSTSLIPVLRFGRFSAAFERVDNSLDLETAVRIAALLTVPSAFADAAPWPFAIEAGRVLVFSGALHEAIDHLLRQIERGVLETAALRGDYRASCVWPGWVDVAHGAASPAQLRDALHRFVRLNQVTWLASAVKDPLVERFRALVQQSPGLLDPSERDRLFLDSLIMPGRSFIGQRQGVVTGDAVRRREIAVNGLQRGLRGEDVARAMTHLDALGDLVELTERKNTDLAACGRALFGSEANCHAIAGVLGLESGDLDLRCEAAQRALVEAVLAGLPGLWREGRQWMH